MQRAVVTGAAGAIGRRVVALLAEAPDVDSVLAIDRRPANGQDPKVGAPLRRPRERATLADPAVLADADTVVHLRRSRRARSAGARACSRPTSPAAC